MVWARGKKIMSWERLKNDRKGEISEAKENKLASGGGTKHQGKGAGG